MRAFPPDRLIPINGRLGRIVRRLWLGVLSFAVLAQILGLVFVLRNAYSTQPLFAAVGLSSAVEYDGTTTVGPIGTESTRQGIVESSHVVAIHGRPIDPGASAEAIAKRVQAVDGARVEVRLRDPHGVVRSHWLTRSPRHRMEASQRNPISLNLRMGVRLFFSLLSALSLIGSAVLLRSLRSNDSEAMLMSFSFLFMAAVIDPPLLMWMGLNLSAVIDVVTGVWWTLIVIAFAAFPTGRFSPPWLRWTLVFAPVLGMILALDLVSDFVTMVVGIIPPLFILSAQVVRYRQIGPGIERQQIKWAAFGFAAGFMLLGLSLGLANLTQPAWAPAIRSAFNLAVVCTFSLAFAVMPLGLLISLLRYRLWEADAVIRQSASYAILTLFVGFVFTLAADATKEVVYSLFNGEHAIVSTALGALIAVSVFAPARSFVLRWSRRHFDKPLARMRALPARLRRWRQDEDAAEIGMRVLATLAAGIHVDQAALVMLTPTGK